MGRKPTKLFCEPRDTNCELGTSLVDGESNNINSKSLQRLQIFFI